MTSLKDLYPLFESESDIIRYRVYGEITAIKGSSLSAKIPEAHLGDMCLVKSASGADVWAQIIGFQNSLATLAAFTELKGIAPGAKIENTRQAFRIGVSNLLLGKILNVEAHLYDGGLSDTSKLEQICEQREIDAKPPSALKRHPIQVPFQTGVRAIDALCTLGYGQRVALIAGPGSGKSTLLGMIAAQAKADVLVVALVGERGREVREFIIHNLGPELLQKSILIVSTCDESPLRRALAPYTATTIAEYFRDQGKRVLLLVDSLTRAARALRDLALSRGELPVRQGFPSSVFSELPKLLERAGTDSRGSITAVYTLLSSGNLEYDSIAEELKSLLDGHLVLSDSIADRGIRPAIDIPRSLSRVLPHFHSKEDVRAIKTICSALARLERDREIILFGGTPDAQLAKIMHHEEEIHAFLNQDRNEAAKYSQSISGMRALAQQLTMHA